MVNEFEEWLKLHKFYLYHGYLTKDLAEYLKVSPRTIQRWMQGQTRPNKKKLALIKKYLSRKNLSESPPYIT